MMSVMPLETCSAFNKFWNNKFNYKVASCWLFLLIEMTSNYNLHTIDVIKQHRSFYRHYLACH